MSPTGSEAEPSQTPGSEPVASDDENQTYWSAIEILKERKGEYLVKWAGTDPHTGKPWKPTWEPKHYCLPGLIKPWKLKQAEEKDKKKRKSTSNRRTSHAPTSSRTGPKSSTPSTTVSDRNTGTRLKATSTTLQPVASSSKTVKRTRLPSTDSSINEIIQVEGMVEIPSPPRKKRKIVRDDVIEDDIRRPPSPISPDVPVSSKSPKPKDKPGGEVGQPTMPRASHFGVSNGLLSPRNSFAQRNSPQQSELTKPSNGNLKTIKANNPATASTIDPSLRRPPRATPEKHSPVLSPNALARLAEFDALDLELRDYPPSPPFQQPETDNTAPPPNSGQDDSYRTGFVPETQLEVYNSQPQSQKRHGTSTPPPYSSPKAGLHKKSPTTPRSSKISRMKPKTPQRDGKPAIGASDIDDAPPQRVLKRLPMMSPSKFVPHIEAQDSIDSDYSEEANNPESEDTEDANARPPMSSIEQFSSPEKRNRKIAKKREALGKAVSLDSFNNKKIFARGQELAEAATRQKRTALGQKTPIKRPLHEVVRNGHAGHDDLLDFTLEDDTQDSVVARGIVARREEEEESTQDILNEGPGDDIPNASTEVQATGQPAHLTDDEDAEDLIPPPRINLKARIRSADSLGTSPMKELQRTPAKLQKTSSLLNGDHAVAKLPSPYVAAHKPPAEPEPSPRSQSFPPSQTRHLSAALSLLNIKSEEIIRLEGLLTSNQAKSDELLNAEKAKTETLTKEIKWLQQSLAEAKIQPMLEDGEHLSNERLAELKAREADREKIFLALEDAQSDIVALRAERDALRSEKDSWVTEKSMLKQKADAAAVKATDASRELAALRETCDTEHATLQALLNEATIQAAAADRRFEDLKAETENWMSERARLNAKFESAANAKAMAESDANFFREQYTQASRFVTATREENAELEQQVKIADGRAAEGVASLKAMFQGRIDAAERETKRFQHLVNLLTEKDMRTNNEIRRRAAEEPQLRKKCEDLQEDLFEAAELRLKLEREAEEHETSREEWEEQRERLVAELEQTKAKLLALQAQSQPTSDGQHLTPISSVASESSDGQPLAPTPRESLALRHGSEESREDDERVYRCRWIDDLDNIPQPCQAYFSSTEELRNHMYDDHSLIRPSSPDLED